MQTQFHCGFTWQTEWPFSSTTSLMFVNIVNDNDNNDNFINKRIRRA